MRTLWLPLLLVTGCTGGNTVPASTQPVIVAVTPGLRAEFDAVVAAFKSRHPDVAATVLTATPDQIAQESLPVDVVAAESGDSIQPLAPKLLAGERRDFAANPLCLVAKAGAPEVRLHGLSTTPWVHKVGLADGRGDATGAAAEAALGRLGVRRALDGHLVYAGGGDDVLQKLAKGEVDVAFALAADVAAWNAKEGAVRLQIADRYADELHSRYPIAILTGTQHLAAARALIEEVLHGEGPKLFAQKGLLPPSAERLER